MVDDTAVQRSHRGKLGVIFDRVLNNRGSLIRRAIIDYDDLTGKRRRKWRLAYAPQNLTDRERLIVNWNDNTYFHTAGQSPTPCVNLRLNHTLGRENPPLKIVIDCPLNQCGSVLS